LSKYQIKINGQEYSVEIDDPNASPVQVTVNGKPFEVTISQEGDRAAPSTAPRSEVDDDMTLVESYVPVVASTFVDVGVEPETIPSSTAPAAAAASGQGPALSITKGAEPVTAPMPGTILDIAVKAGDQVAQGDTLCNLEAMKMKSPIRAPSAGTIVQVLISEGQNVSYGDTLFTLG
jgi:acetyl-CoA/propionyl-CoA carboxylase biotin carboxyl carrier protein